jgi:hypothetical protein
VQNGLLKRNHAEDKYSFTHPTFQEYYVAKEIKDANRIGELYDHLGDPAWLEVVLFFCGLADFEVTGKLISDILDQRSDYVLAGRCLSHSPVGIAGAAERIVPELIRERSQAAQAALLEIGDDCVIEHLCDVLLLKPGPAPEDQLFARECLGGLKGEAVTQCVHRRADGYIKIDHLQDTLDCLAPFKDYGPTISEMISQVGNKLTNKQNSTLAKFREHISQGSFSSAETVLQEYEKTEGSSARFGELLRIGRDLRDGWTAASALIAEDASEENKQLERIRFAWAQFSSICKQLSIDTWAFEEKLAGYCVDRLSGYGEVDAGPKWTGRARCISYRAFRVMDSARGRTA